MSGTPNSDPHQQGSFVMSSIATEIELCRRWATYRVEALSEQAPMYSRTAYTHQYTQHRAFGNGWPLHEGAPPPPGTLAEMTEAFVRNVAEYAMTVPAPRVLVWRIEPTFEQGATGEWTMSARLCFETAPQRRTTTG